MKKIILTVVVILCIMSAMAQVPQKMSYQAVIRNSSNELIISKQAGMKISIIKGSLNGDVVYTETRFPVANANGLVTLEIGVGSGFSQIDWANGPYFIKTETDPNGGSAFSISHVCQLLSVPYAMYAEQSGSTHISGNEAVFEGWDKNHHDDVTLSDAQTITGSKTFTSMIQARGIALPYTFGPDTAYVGSEGAFIGFGHEGHSEDFIGYKNNRFYFKDSPEGGDTRDPDVVVGGNIGIGIDEPWERLEVDGRINMHDHHIMNLADPVNEQDAATKAYVDASGLQSETDPVFSESVAAGIEPQDLDRWDQAHGWGDHSAEGYLTDESDPAIGEHFDFSDAKTGDLLRFNGSRWVRFTPDYLLMEGDPIFNSSAAAGITSTSINQWNTTYSWGNHASQGYVTSESDPTWSGTANQSSNIGREGNVGIGTTNPTQKLDVNGQMRIRGGNPGEGKVLTSDAAGLARWESSSSATGIDGKGTINNIPRFTAEKTLGNSILYQSGSSIGIDESPSGKDTKFFVHHNVRFAYPDPNPTYLALFQTSSKIAGSLIVSDIAYIKTDGEAWFKGPLKVGDFAHIKANGEVWFKGPVTVGDSHDPLVKKYKAGDWAHGGVVFWVDETGQHGLVCDKKDVGTNWWFGADDMWDINAVSVGIYGGKMNTSIIVAVSSAIAGRYGVDISAAEECVRCKSSGYGDWYLPSKDELNLMYQNSLIINKTAQANGGSSFITSGAYWSSTESGYRNAWLQNFGGGLQGYGKNKDSNKIRCIRSF